jgi:hypothetical protein
VGSGTVEQARERRIVVKGTWERLVVMYARACHFLSVLDVPDAYVGAHAGWAWGCRGKGIRGDVVLTGGSGQWSDPTRDRGTG